jgi:hypothetical protein
VYNEKGMGREEYEGKHAGHIKEPCIKMVIALQGRKARMLLRNRVARQTSKYAAR